MPAQPPIHPPHDPGAAARMGGEQSRAKEVHDLVGWCIRERTRAIDRGWSKVAPDQVAPHLRALRAWHNSFRVPTPETQRRLLHEMWHHVRAVMPGNKAGFKKLDRLRALLEQA